VCLYGNAQSVAVVERFANLYKREISAQLRFPTVAEVLNILQENDALDEFVVCELCAAARNITEDDLADWATFGSATDLARLAEAHETTVTF
jgi:predicted peroxiredoxin